MIKLNVTKNLKAGVKHDFSVHSDEPVTVTVTQLREGNLIAYVYRTVEPGEDEDPVGCYDSTVKNEGWEDPPPMPLDVDACIEELLTLARRGERFNQALDRAEAAMERKLPGVNFSIRVVYNHGPAEPPGFRLCFQSKSADPDLESLSPAGELHRSFDEIERHESDGSITIIKSRYT